jgi:hypothetical protein
MALRQVVQVTEADFPIIAARREGLLHTQLGEHWEAARQHRENAARGHRTIQIANEAEKVGRSAKSLDDGST